MAAYAGGAGSCPSWSCEKSQRNLKKALDKGNHFCIIVSVRQDTAGLCKGSTADSDSVCLGSNPGTAAKSLGLREPRLFYEVWLSLVERYVRDVEVAGSNPVTSTKNPGFPPQAGAPDFLVSAGFEPFKLLSPRPAASCRSQAANLTLQGP